jgi:chromosome segregation ATPase
MTNPNSTKESAFQAPPLENSVLQQRLTQGVGGGNAARGSLSRCAVQYREFLKHYLAADGDAETIETLKQDLTRDFELYLVEMKKVSLSTQAAVADTKQLETEMTQVQSKIQKLQADIEVLRNEQPKARQIRRNLEEYEALAKMANTRPSRRVLEERMATVKQELEEVEVEAQKNREEKAIREKQFHLFMQSLFDLKESLAADVEEKGHEAEEGEEDEGEVHPMDTT